MMISRNSEITALSQALGFTLAEDWAGRLARYEPALEKYLEYQISLDKGELAVITLGSQETFLDEIESHLKALKASPDAFATFRTLRYRVERATWGLKLALGPKEEIQIYLKKPLPLEQVILGLQNQGLEPAAAAQLKAIAAQLDKSHTHFFGADFTPGQPVPYQIYFTQYITEDQPVLERLRRVRAELGLPPALDDTLTQAHTLLAQPKQTLWVSVSLVNGRLHPSLKLDYGSIPFRTAAGFLETFRFPEAAYDHLRLTAETLKVRIADYMSVRLRADTSPTSSIYLTRIR